MLALGSCAQNASFELEMQLPVAPVPGATALPDAFVRVALDTDGPENDDATFDAWNDGTAASAPEERQFSLGAERCLGQGRTFPCNMRMSLVTTHVDADVIVQIRFCNAGLAQCDEGSHPPELRYHIEHPFYRGQRTFLRTGPLDTSSGSYSYYLRSDFPELCEQPTAVDRATRVIWRCRVEGCFDSTRGQYPSPDYGWCTTATGPAFVPPDACVEAGTPDASASVVGVIGGRPPHQCERAASCAVAPTARGGAAMATVLGALVIVLARRGRERRRA